MKNSTQLFFIAATVLTSLSIKAQVLPDQKKQNPGSVATASDPPEEAEYGKYTPNRGFKIANTKYGDLNFKLYAQMRYLNQLDLDTSFTDSFGTTKSVNQRQDIQVNKAILYFHGWLMNPKFRYLSYTWTTNTSQGQAAQVVVAGNVTYAFNKHLLLGVGINGLPGVRTTEGTFPFWLPTDNRLIADEFFRPSYTTGIFARGAITKDLQYTMMLGNNISQLGVDAGQLDNKINTFSGGLIWHPTTGEFGPNDNFGDLEAHEKVATRLAAHYTRSDENRQGQPNTAAFENVTIRLSDGNPIFTPDLYGKDIQLDDVTYHMTAIDAGIKYKGFSLEGEFYYRLVNNFRGRGTDSLSVSELNDNGFQLQISGMIFQKTLQLYAGTSKVFGEYGDPEEYRAGINWYPAKNHVARFNVEFMYLTKCPVGGLALPYPVGANGLIYLGNLEINF